MKGREVCALCNRAVIGASFGLLYLASAGVSCSILHMEGNDFQSVRKNKNKIN